MNVAIVGCEFVADFYLGTLPLHRELKLLGVTDRVAAPADRLSKFHDVPKYESLAALLADPKVEMPLNLTNPRDHYEVSKAALNAGKHVYSEKPLAMNMQQATELVGLAEEKGQLIASAPCSLLG